jgi:hypothetical protein
VLRPVAAFNYRVKLILQPDIITRPSTVIFTGKPPSKFSIGVENRMEINLRKREHKFNLTTIYINNKFQVINKLLAILFFIWKTTTNTKVVPFMPQKNRVRPHSALTQVTTRLISSKGVE